MPNVFEQKKRRILEQLSIPDADYTDLSPKGSVDEGVRVLCDEINATDGLVTTSSCAGRIAVFLEGGANSSKGGGRWLFVSHDPLDLSPLQEEDAIWKLFGIPQHNGMSCPPRDEAVRFVHLKFEPMILHILTSSLSKAQHVHSAAMSAGFRESGISGVDGDSPTPLVAVRTQGLAFDSIIAYQDPSGDIVPMVSEEYLRTVLNIANQRFVTNGDRKERFRQALLGKSTDGNEAKSEWEPADVRRERKRAEGLRRREEAKQRELNGNSLAADCDSEDGYDLGALSDDTAIE